MVNVSPSAFLLLTAATLCSSCRPWSTLPTVMSQRADSGSHLKGRDVGGSLIAAPIAWPGSPSLYFCVFCLRGWFQGGLEAVKDNGTTVACVVRPPGLPPVPAGGPPDSFLSEFRGVQYSLSLSRLPDTEELTSCPLASPQPYP